MAIIYNKRKNGWDVENITSQRKPHLIEVDVKMAGICRTDIYAMEGKIDLMDKMILGHEASGVISYIPKNLRKKAGEKGLDVGSRVGFFPFLPCNRCRGCEGGMEKCFNPVVIGKDMNGAFCEKIHLPVEVIEASGLSFKELAYMEPLSAAISLLDIEYGKDDTVGIVGEGRIADICLKILKMKKSDAVILKQKDYIKNSFDVIIETRANKIKEAVRVVRPGGKIILKSRPMGEIHWPHQDIVMKRINIIGSPYGKFKRAIKMVENKEIDIENLMGMDFPMTYEGVEKALEMERDGNEKMGKLFFNVGDV